MIVISGALVLVALVLLVLGLTLQDLAFVYGSIGVSLVSFVFLLVGILQRRGEPAAATAGGPSVVEDVPGTASGGETRTAALVAPAQRDRTGSDAAVEQEPDDEDADVEPSSGSGVSVLVVPGRPRYHVEGCRYLTGKEVEEVDLEQAREQYSACGVCRPEEQLSALSSRSAGADEPEQEPVVDSGVPGAEDADAELEPEPVAAPARSRGRTAAASTSRRGTTAAAGTAPSTRRRTRSVAVDPAPVDETPQPAVEEAAEKPAPRKRAARTPAAGTASSTRSGRGSRAAVLPDAPPVEADGALAEADAAVDGAVVEVAPAEAAPVDGAPVEAAAATPAKKAPARRGRVVVIPDRGRYHTPQCRFVRDVASTEELTRTQAEKQGYQACGVCKP